MKIFFQKKSLLIIFGFLCGSFINAPLCAMKRGNSEDLNNDAKRLCLDPTPAEGLKQFIAKGCQAALTDRTVFNGSTLPQLWEGFINLVLLEPEQHSKPTQHVNDHQKQQILTMLHDIEALEAFTPWINTTFMFFRTHPTLNSLKTLIQWLLTPYQKYHPTLEKLKNINEYFNQKNFELWQTNDEHLFDQEYQHFTTMVDWFMSNEHKNIIKHRSNAHIVFHATLASMQKLVEAFDCIVASINSSDLDSETKVKRFKNIIDLRFNLLKEWISIAPTYETTGSILEFSCAGFMKYIEDELNENPKNSSVHNPFIASKNFDCMGGRIEVINPTGAALSLADINKMIQQHSLTLIHSLNLFFRPKPEHIPQGFNLMQNCMSKYSKELKRGFIGARFCKNTYTECYGIDFWDNEDCKVTFNYDSSKKIRLEWELCSLQLTKKFLSEITIYSTIAALRHNVSFVIKEITPNRLSFMFTFDEENINTFTNQNGIIHRLTDIINNDDNRTGYYGGYSIVSILSSHLTELIQKKNSKENYDHNENSFIKTFIKQCDEEDYNALRSIINNESMNIHWDILYQFSRFIKCFKPSMQYKIVEDIYKKITQSSQALTPENPYIELELLNKLLQAFKDKSHPSEWPQVKMILRGITFSICKLFDNSIKKNTNTCDKREVNLLLHHIEYMHKIWWNLQFECEEALDKACLLIKNNLKGPNHNLYRLMQWKINNFIKNYYPEILENNAEDNQRWSFYKNFRSLPKTLAPERTLTDTKAQFPDLELTTSSDVALDHDWNIMNVKVLHQLDKQNGINEMAQTDLWLKSIKPQFIRNGWGCGLHAMKNAFYLCKFFICPADQFDTFKEELIKKFQNYKQFFKIIEWPIKQLPQPSINIPLDVAQEGREKVMDYLAEKMSMMNLVPGPQGIAWAPASWGMTWTKQRAGKRYQETTGSDNDHEMSYVPQPQPALYSVIYNPATQPDDLFNLARAIQSGNTYASQSMKELLDDMIIMSKPFSCQERYSFSAKDKRILNDLTQQIIVAEKFIVPILWSYETPRGFHWVCIIIIKKDNHKEMLIADPSPHNENRLEKIYMRKYLISVIEEK